MKDAVFGAVGTIVAFQVGSSEDAVLLERQFGTLNEKHMGTRRDFLSLPPYQCCVNWGDNEGTMINMYPPIGELIPAWRPGRADVVVGESRRRFGRAREKVEERIGRLLARPVDMQKKRRSATQRVQ
jgi:hypothetical protein